MNKDPEKYRLEVITKILEKIQPVPEILAAWEGGSAATGTRDQFSDIDLNILTSMPLNSVLDMVEGALAGLGVDHKWQPLKCFWGEGMMQRVLMLKDAPRYFLVDIAVFDKSSPQLLKDFLEVERHGKPPVLFDKGSYIKFGHTDAGAMFVRQQSRAHELSQGFPVYKSLVQKELARGQSIDAFNFYFAGMVRPYVELLGMIHRPFKFDFGLRYLHRHLPPEMSAFAEQLVFVKDASDLNKKVELLEGKFFEAYFHVKNRTML